jgi:hypothetical protein
MEILTQAKTAVRIVTAAVVALVLAWSLAMQLYVNSLHYFAFQQVEYALKMQKVHGVDEYIQEKTALHRGFMCRDMLLFHLGKKPFKPFQIMENADISQAQRRDIPRLVRFVGDYCEPNYMFLMK